MNPKIYLSPPHLSSTEYDFVDEALRSNWIAPIGPYIDKFENELQKYIFNSSKKAFLQNNILALNSGTAAIHLGLKLLGISKGDVVICQSFTFMATANPILYLEAEPVFVDSEKETWNMCPVLLEKAIQNVIKKKKKPKAIIAVHSYGMPYNVEKIHAIAKKYEISVIEDSAEALGSKFKKEFCGTFGDFSVFSFNGNKIITTSGGGALICKNAEIKAKGLYLATQARDKGSNYIHNEIGYNYRMSNISAAIGCGQMTVIDKRVKARRNNHQFYKEELKECTDIEFLNEPKGFYSNRWLSCILTSSQKMRDEIIFALKAENIESRTFWKPLHTQPVFRDNNAFVNGISEDLYSKGVCLPSGSNLSENDLQKITAVIKKVYRLSL
ncbi:aminotransferase class I/II-fold pyridoxal phosphate-dependent enzyme [Lutibacter sp. B1]|uniref:aminotransferase class I/II-fold pyridoxal phosphate-dependent enzyme n=1 Tax=Lutibacter sp. B1 TaxID=2725996 RepID=UPI0014574DFC|nr:aminotransferase class I/II-fold pyridoxal phosphate-dependent enzyme [Lutibacter sp. B1]NLP58834.1 aminotransferase class I/II-fold pyridoxal phosphate-dependent enzyme [Lutibacter sp. B1]